MYFRLLLVASLLSGLTIRADFSYEQTSKVTGGAMAGMMKMAGAFSAKARQPIVSTVMVRGDRMANVTGDRIHIIDLGRETFTDIDLAHKTYSVMTFAELGDAMKQMAEKMGQSKNDANLSFKTDVKETGQSRTINGLNTSEKIVTLIMEGTDSKTGQTGGMNMQMDMWIAPNMPGYDEVRNFYQRMALKVNWSPMMRMAGPLAAQNQKGMSELIKQMAKLDGIPVLQITKLGVSGSGMPSEAEMQRAQADAARAQQQSAAQQQPSQPNIADAATRTASTGALGKAGRVGAIANGLGGFGGFGRKKKTEETAATAPTPAAAPQETASAAANTGSSGALMELTTELTQFSSSVDSSKFEVPSGFKQVPSDIKKSMQ